MSIVARRQRRYVPNDQARSYSSAASFAFARAALHPSIGNLSSPATSAQIIGSIRWCWLVLACACCEHQEIELSPFCRLFHHPLRPIQFVSDDGDEDKRCASMRPRSSRENASNESRGAATIGSVPPSLFPPPPPFMRYPSGCSITK